MSDTQRATGSFDVKLPTQSLSHTAGGELLGRRGLDKVFHGDLDGTSQGEMLYAMTATQGSAGYVAIEYVTGTLHGRRGSFALQHSSTMTRGEPRQSVTVVPDSGTGELEGLTGSMTIIIEPGGKHRYEFDYALG